MLFPVHSHPDAPRYFQGVHGPVNIIDEHRQRTSPQANLLMQLADCARSHPHRAYANQSEKSAPSRPRGQVPPDGPGAAADTAIHPGHGWQLQLWHHADDHG